MRVWTNVYLAETWEDEGERIDDYSVSERAEVFPEKLDERIQVLTAEIGRAHV